MTQLSVEVPDPIAEQLRQRAAAQGRTVSEYLADLVCGTLTNDWPSLFFEEVVGSWRGEPLERPPKELLNSVRASKCTCSIRTPAFSSSMDRPPSLSGGWRNIPLQQSASVPL